MGVSPLALFNVAASALLAQQRSLDVVANNLANLMTPGFKAVRADLTDLRPGDRPDEGGLAGGTWVAGTTRDFRRGTLIWTGNPLDLAIDGPGFFRVRLPDGRWGYTRDGTFRRDADGHLVTAKGFLVDTDVQLAPEDHNVTISPDGSVWAETGNGQRVQRGTLVLYRFPNPEGLEAVGDNLFVETPASGAAQAGTPGAGLGRLVVGAYERSNVDVAQEFARMLFAQRSYSLSVRVFQVLDEMQREANRLTT